MATLAEKDKEAFWELMLLPMATWGTTAGTIKTAKQFLKKPITVKEDESLQYPFLFRRKPAPVSDKIDKIPKIHQGSSNTAPVKITSMDLKLPSPTNLEAQLAKQGFSNRFTAGLDSANEWVAVKTSLQELKANPETTHIEYFANQIPDFFRKNISNLPPEKRKKAELVYFIMTHENLASMPLSSKIWDPFKLKKAISYAMDADTAGLFNFPQDITQKRLRQRDLRDAFMEAYKQTKQQL